MERKEKVRGLERGLVLLSPKLAAPGTSLPALVRGKARLVLPPLEAIPLSQPADTVDLVWPL